MKLKLLKFIFLSICLLKSSYLLALKHRRLQRKQLNWEDSGMFLELKENFLTRDVTRSNFIGFLRESMKESGIILKNRPLSQGSFGVVFSSKNIYGIAVKGVHFDSIASNRAAVESELAVMAKTKDFFFSAKLCSFKEVLDKGYALIMPEAENDLLETAKSYYKQHLSSKKLISVGKIKGLLGYPKTKIDQKYYAQFVPKLKQVVQMALGLEEFHETGLVHTDIKPGNYLVMDDGRVVLADFGLATVAINDYLEGDSGTRGYIPYDTQKVEKRTNRGVKLVEKLYLSQKLDTYALGISILNLIVPQFYRCFNEENTCKFANFDKIKGYDSKVMQTIKEFRDHLEKNVLRKISPIQLTLENIVFEQLLVQREQRLSSSDFVTILWEIVPRKLITEVKDKYMVNTTECTELYSSTLETSVPEDFKVRDYSK